MLLAKLTRKIDDAARPVAYRYGVYEMLNRLPERLNRNEAAKISGSSWRTSSRAQTRNLRRAARSREGRTGKNGIIPRPIGRCRRREARPSGWRATSRAARGRKGSRTPTATATTEAAERAASSRRSGGNGSPIRSQKYPTNSPPIEPRMLISWNEAYAVGRSDSSNLSRISRLAALVPAGATRPTAV